MQKANGHNESLDHLLNGIHKCLRKVRYRTMADTEVPIATLWLEKGRNLVAYGCKWCGCYHLTHGKWNDNGKLKE